MGAPPIDIHVCQVLRHTYTLTMVQTFKKPSKKYYPKFPYLLVKSCLLAKLLLNSLPKCQFVKEESGLCLDLSNLFLVLSGNWVF